MTRKTASFCASVVAALVACVIGGMTASAGTSAAAHPQANMLAGTWESTINLPCARTAGAIATGLQSHGGLGRDVEPGPEVALRDVRQLGAH